MRLSSCCCCCCCVAFTSFRPFIRSSILRFCPPRSPMVAKGSSKVGTKELERICGGRLQALNACFKMDYTTVATQPVVSYLRFLVCSWQHGTEAKTCKASAVGHVPCSPETQIKQNMRKQKNQTRPSPPPGPPTPPTQRPSPPRARGTTVSEFSAWPTLQHLDRLRFC